MSIPIPEYMRIRQFVVNRVANANGRAVKIPSERALAKKFDVARGTVRRALEDLVEEGFLVPKRGMGTFVNPEKSSAYRVQLSRKIGLILAGGMLVNITRQFQRELAGVFDALEQYDAAVQLVNFTIRSPAETFADVAALGFDGLLWLHPTAQHTELPAYFFERMSNLVVASSWLMPGWTNVVLDDYQGAMLTGVEKLIEHAGAEVVFVGRDDKHPDARQLFAAFEDLFARRGLRRPPEYDIPADNIAKPLQRLLRTRHPRAVYSQGGEFGRAAMEVLARENDSLPPGCTFLCQDAPEMKNLPSGMNVIKILSPESRRMGKAAGAMLAELIEKRMGQNGQTGLLKVERKLL